MKTLLLRLRSRKGSLSLEYAFALAVFLILTMAFVSVSSGVLRGGLDTTASDLGRQDSLDVVIGVVPIEVAQELLLEEGEVPTAFADTPYSFSFGSFAQVPRGVAQSDTQWRLVSQTPLPAGFSFNTQTGVLSGTFAGGETQEINIAVYLRVGAQEVGQSYVFVARNPGLYLRPVAPPLVEPQETYSFSFEDVLDVPAGADKEDVSWSVLALDTELEGLTVSQLDHGVYGIFQGEIANEMRVQVRARLGSLEHTRVYTIQTTRLWLAPRPTVAVPSGTSVSWNAADFVQTDDPVVLDEIVWRIDVLDVNGEVRQAPRVSVVEGSRFSGVLRSPVDESFGLRVQASYGPWQSERVYGFTVLGSGLSFFGGEAALVELNTDYLFDLKTQLEVSPDFSKSDVSWSLVSGDLPTGLTLSAGSGLVSGRYSGAPGRAFSALVRASHPSGSQDTAVVTFEVVEEEQFDTDVELPTVVFGQAYSFELSRFLNRGEPSDFTWTIRGAALPEGLIFDRQSYAITGLPLPLKDNLGEGAFTGEPLLLVFDVLHNVTGQRYEWTRTMRVDGLAPLQAVMSVNTACSLDFQGNPWCWGSRRATGNLGNDLVGGATTPQPVSQDGPRKRFIDISINGNTSCALDDTGQAWCWGRGTSGERGDGTTNSGFAMTKVDQSVVGLGAKQVSVGGTHACLVSAQDRVWCWGAGAAGRLGNGGSVSSSVPVPVQTNEMSLPVVSISVGSASACAIDTAQNAWCWGAGGLGRLGNGASTNVSRPVQVSKDTNMGAVSHVEVGNTHACATDIQGSVWCWGSNDGFKLGADYGQDQTTPRRIVNPLAMNMTAVANADTFACGINERTGTASCWGSQASNRLGNGVDSAEARGPAAVDLTGVNGRLIGLGVNIAAPAAACGWTSTGQIYCWGSNVAGALGNPNGPAVALTPREVLFQ